MNSKINVYKLPHKLQLNQLINFNNSFKTFNFIKYLPINDPATIVSPSALLITAFKHGTTTKTKCYEFSSKLYI